jgi:diguanylate cyclase (GGDEF)-like protein
MSPTMLARFQSLVGARLEAYLAGGPENASPQVALAHRRARGFALIGACTIFVGGFVSSIVIGSPVFVVGSIATILVQAAAIRLGAIGDGRHFVVATHATLAACAALVFASMLDLGYASPVGVTFSVLIIMAANFILGTRAAIGWTAVSIVGVTIGVVASEPIPFPADAQQPSHALILTSRIVVLLGTCAISTAERRFSDWQSRELLALASHDSLTGLLNRRAFRERLADSLARARRHGRRVGLIFLDLDDFKQVNDAHGHAVGDALLRRIGRHFAAVTRDGDCAGRAGGDEFVMLLEDVGEAKNVKHLAERILAELESDDLRWLAPGIEMGVSIGAACFPDDARDVESLMHAADVAMYGAKASGGGSVRTNGEAPIGGA